MSIPNEFAEFIGDAAEVLYVSNSLDQALQDMKQLIEQYEQGAI